MSAYMKGQFVFYGIDAKSRKALQRPFVNAALKLDPDNFKAWCRAGWSDPHRECQYAVVDAMTRYVRKMDRSFFTLIEEFIITKPWWDTVDFLSGTILGGLFKAYPDEIPARTARLIGSANMWENRSAILFQLKYKADMDIALLSDFIAIKKEDREFFIQKSIGWILRTLSKFNPDAVKELLEIHPELSNLARREASKYL